ncbi:immunity 63 family protein [Mycolicibacterium mengxianglii]|uniref:immunity 63 family protein n=1 Tax=Mycolicibacterium mengxianglii TaxID=2736649 RepID=UPI001E63389A|nr:immunity 63 family protein [Mycolicibacterium mengxianglii]
MTADHPLNDKSEELQLEIDRISERLGVRSMPVGLRTNDGLNVYIADDGTYHHAFYERGKLNSEQIGALDDVLYWYCSDIVTDLAARRVGDRAQRFLYQYQVLSSLNPEWAKRQVRENAAKFRDHRPKDLALLPDIGEPL